MLLYLAILLSSCALIIFAFRLSILTLLISPTHHTELDFSPNDLSIGQVILIIAVLSTKALQQAFGLSPKLHLDESSKNLDQGFALPALRLRAPLVVKPQDISRYETALDLRMHGEKRSTDLSIFSLVGLTTPLLLLLVAKRSCPILPLGSVNVRNRFEFLRPRLCHDAARGLLKGLGAQARLHTAGRRVKRGIEFDVVIEVTTGKIDMVKDQIIFRQTITILQFISRSVKPMSEEHQALQPGPRPVSGRDIASFDQIDWKLDIDLSAPMRWAAFSKDFNPIHVSSWAAKIFGFRGSIAHGNLAVGRSLAVLTGIEGPQFSKMWLPNSRPSWLEVEFKRPMVVPIQFELMIDEQDERNVVTSQFRVVRDSKTYVQGHVGWL